MVVKRLALVQQIATLAITGAIQSISNTVLNVHAFLPLLHLAVCTHCFWAILRISTLSDNHPLGPIIQKTGKRNCVHQQSPIHRLLITFPEVNPLQTEKIPLTGQAPWLLPPLPHKIIANQAAAVEQAKDIPNTHVFCIYTDGLGLNSQARASAVLYYYFEEQASLQYHLGPLLEHTVHKVEGVAATLGLHFLATATPAWVPGCVDIGIDNQAILKADFNGKQNLGSHILQRIAKLADRAKKKMTSPKHLRMVWAPGHKDVKGNKHADKLAQQASARFISRPQDLPAYL